MVADPVTPKLGRLGSDPFVITSPPIVAEVPVATTFPFETVNP